MKRGGPLRRFKRLNPIGRKRAAYERELNGIRAQVRERSGGMCEVRILHVCMGQAQHVHHRRLRSHGGTNDLENLLATCFGCHQYVHSNPQESYERGWMIHG